MTILLVVSGASDAARGAKPTTICPDKILDFGDFNFFDANS
jgi:hypothetical protein